MRVIKRMEWKGIAYALLGLALMLCGIDVQAALSCGPVYSSQIINGGTFSPRLYTLSGTTATFVSSASQNLDGIGQAATSGTIYFDNGGNTTVRSYDGTLTVSYAPNNWLSYGTGSGPGGAPDGFIYYVGNGTTKHLFRVNTLGVVTDLGVITPSAGDSIWQNMTAGDLAADANGRLYWLGSSGASTYLYLINPTTLTARSLGTYGPSGATGLAFDTAGKLVSTVVTGNTTTVYSIDLSTPNTVGTNLGTVTGYSNNGAALDLASCNAPNVNPALSTTKTVSNITQGQTPATLASSGDILEYTITVTNNGTLPSDSATLSDAIPSNTTYVANSTTLNGGAVADAPAGTMPYSPASTGTREIHGSGRTAGVILVGAGSAAVIKLRVTVGAAPLPVTIDNQATASYPITSGGTTSTQTAPSTVVKVPTPKPKLTLTKTVTNDNGGTQLATAWTLSASGPTPISGVTGSAAVTNAVVDPGTYTLSESGPPNYVASAWSCTAGTLSGSSLTLGYGHVANCTINNNDSNVADLSIIKKTTTSPVVSGQPISYAITVSNNGPATGIGAIVKDSPVNGITCPTTNTVTCTGTGCPGGSITVNNLLSGITMGTMAAGSSATLTFSCTVN